MLYSTVNGTAISVVIEPTDVVVDCPDNCKTCFKSLCYSCQDFYYLDNEGFHDEGCMLIPVQWFNTNNKNIFMQIIL